MNASCSTGTLVIHTSTATILADTQGCSNVAFAHQGGTDYFMNISLRLYKCEH